MTHEQQNSIEISTSAMAIARAMRNLGKSDRAVKKYDEALAALPLAIEALDECLSLLEELEAWPAIADRCASWLRDFPDHATNDNADRIHARRIDALIHLGGLDLAFETYGLRPISRSEDCVDDSEILCVIVARDEIVRLPHLLDHHRSIGVDRFLVIDNGSTDGSIDLLNEQDDAIVWQSTQSYRSANCGAVWWQLLLRRYASANWCLVVDADEWFIYPGWETDGLRSLCAALDAQGSTCYPAILLDMYGRNSLSASVIHTDSELLDEFPFFDRNWYRMRSPYCGPRHNLINHWGGVRARVFGDQSLGSYLLDKIPLFRSRPDQILMSGNHWIDRPSDEISDGRGALLHHKYDAGFATLVRREARRAEHAGAARAYRKLDSKIQENDDPKLFDSDYSVRFENSQQLLQMGVLRPLTTDGTPPPATHLIHIPSVSEAPRSKSDSDVDPFWSIVIVAGPVDPTDRISDLLEALTGQPPSEIVVVVTGGADPPVHSSAQDASHQVRFVPTDNYLTEIEALNLGVRNSLGRWVHLLETGAMPSFDGYVKARATLDTNHDRLNSVLVEASEPIESAVSLAFDLAPSSFLAHRHAFTTHGGLSTTIAGASVWEFLQRITLKDPDGVRHVPQLARRRPRIPLVPVTLEFGEDISHQLIAISHVTREHAIADAPTTHLIDRCGENAITRITQDIERGRPSSALAITAEILSSPISESRRQILLRTLARRLL